MHQSNVPPETQQLKLATKFSKPVISYSTWNIKRKKRREPQLFISFSTNRKLSENDDEMKPMDLLCYVKICFGVLITSWFDKGDSQFRMENICMFEDFLQREYHSE